MGIKVILKKKDMTSKSETSKKILRNVEFGIHNLALKKRG